MTSVLDHTLGIHPQALDVAAKRLELLAGNIANADTPGFKARDVDFRQALKQATGGAGVTLSTTAPGHLAAGGAGAAPEVLYRVPSHASLDGNTVDNQQEHAAFAENAVRYQAALDFINSRLRGLRTALRGE